MNILLKVDSFNILPRFFNKSTLKKTLLIKAKKDKVTIFITYKKDNYILKLKTNIAKKEFDSLTSYKFALCHLMLAKLTRELIVIYQDFKRFNYNKKDIIINI